jgi:hypothetical protein
MANEQDPGHRLRAQFRRFRDWYGSDSGKRAQKWLSLGISAIILVVLVRSILKIGWSELVAAVPSQPLFYLLFAAAYAIPPCFDWFFYHRWWGIGWRAIAIFLRKRIMNETLISYSGDTYLLLWATGRLGIRHEPGRAAPLLGRNGSDGLDPRRNPFAAIKDVAITSGLAGNGVTLLMLLLALALGGGDVLSSSLDAGTLRTMALGFGALVAVNIAIVLFRGRVMSLSEQETRWLFLVQLFRVLLNHALILLSWYVVMPEIAFSGWIVLGAIRMVMSRLPLPNKELLFAAVAGTLTGGASVEVAALMFVQGALHILCHGIAWAAAMLIDPTGEHDGEARTG